MPNSSQSIPSPIDPSDEDSSFGKSFPNKKAQKQCLRQPRITCQSRWGVEHPSSATCIETENVLADSTSPFAYKIYTHIKSSNEDVLLFSAELQKVSK
jgi:hypothetical protein